MKRYNPKRIEKKWQRAWDEAGVYRTQDLSSKPKYFILDMFPYPSGEGLHVGHPKGYIATDIFSRYKRMKGFNVLHPMGWDAFGLPAENYAIKNKIHPRKAVQRNIARYKEQLSKIGLDYDWSREINTTDPKYYKWTQWIFLQLFKRGLAYESREPINWCPSCKTGLANEDLEGGKCERCGSDVEKKPLRQWVLNITKYADRLLEDLDTLDWPESVKEIQRNWIGRSEGAEIEFRITNHESRIKVFTTRPDTLFGATYLVLAPEHTLIENLKLKIENWNEIQEYIQNVKNKSELERTDLAKEKTGVELKGIKAINPANSEEIPIWVADYVLASYGTGAIMAVPAHDKRDWEFAKKFKLPMKVVIGKKDRETFVSTSADANREESPHCVNSFVQESIEENGAFVDEGVNINSDFLNGLSTNEAKQKVIAWLEKNGYGKRAVAYRLKDWVFSRQRYWGEPIPIIHCRGCWESRKLKVESRKEGIDYTVIDGKEYAIVPVPEDQLPVALPNVRSYEPTGTGESPLAAIKKWVNTKCPQCGGRAKRETNTMPQWAGSSWYYLRYLDPTNDRHFVDAEKEKEGMPVDMYVGGVEHAARHLIYARFWHKFLYDCGFVSTKEPFQHLKNQGLILAEDGRKMSKRWGNVINPDDVISRHGADTLRMYEMFMGPFEGSVAWSTESMIGVRRFLERVWNVVLKKSKSWKVPKSEGHTDEILRQAQGDTMVRPLVHQTIKKVTEDIEQFKMNTCVSQLMIMVNRFESEAPTPEERAVLLKLLSPFAPHLAEELWHMLGNQTFIVNESWPEYDESKLVDETVTVAVQFNGKFRGTISVARGSSQEAVANAVKSHQKLSSYLSSDPKKTIFVPDKIINFVM